MAIRVGICIPNEGHVGCEAYDNRLLFAFHLGKLEAENPGKYEFYWGSVGRVLTPLARERLSEWALDMGLHLILMIDDDMLIPNTMFEQLLKTMDETGADIVAPLAFMRNAPHYPVIYRTTQGYDPMAHKPFFERHFVKNYPKDSVVECDAVGFGSALIKTALFKKMHKPWFMSTTGAGEDIWFCFQAKKEAGAKIVVDTRIKLGHMGMQQVVTEETFEEHNKMDKHREVYGTASPANGVAANA